jgi:hypothetical protein
VDHGGEKGTWSYSVLQARLKETEIRTTTGGIGATIVGWVAGGIGAGQDGKKVEDDKGGNSEEPEDWLPLMKEVINVNEVMLKKTEFYVGHKVKKGTTVRERDGRGLRVNEFVLELEEAKKDGNTKVKQHLCGLKAKHRLVVAVTEDQLTSTEEGDELTITKDSVLKGWPPEEMPGKKAYCLAPRADPKEPNKGTVTEDKLTFTVNLDKKKNEPQAHIFRVVPSDMRKFGQLTKWADFIATPKDDTEGFSRIREHQKEEKLKEEFKYRALTVNRTVWNKKKVLARVDDAEEEVSEGVVADAKRGDQKTNLEIGAKKGKKESVVTVTTQTGKGTSENQQDDSDQLKADAEERDTDDTSTFMLDPDRPASRSNILQCYRIQTVTPGDPKTDNPQYLKFHVEF